MNRRRSGSNGPPPEQQSHGDDSAGKATRYDLTAVAAPAASPLELGDRQPFECPFCESMDANAKYKLDRDGEPRLFIGCFEDRCPIPPRRYLPALSEALRLGEGATKEEIVVALFKRMDPQGRLKLSWAVVAPVINKYGRPS